jgi:hypothetical protein
MDRTRATRWIALAAVLAALVPALSVIAGWLPFVVGWPDPSDLGLRALDVVGLLAALVVAVHAMRRHDRDLLTFAIAAVAFPLASLLPRGVNPVATILFLVARVLLLVFGVLLVRRQARPGSDTTASGSRTGSGRLPRTTGWLVVAGAGLWLGAELVEQLVFRVWMPPQEALFGLFAIPQVGQLVAFVAAAVFFAPPLLRPVGAGVRRLWDTADVR